MTADKDKLSVEMFQTSVEMFQTGGGHKTSFDKATIDLASRRVT